MILFNEIIYHTKHYSQSIPPQLLYRGSRDGFKAKDFHSRCDNQGPTLTIIKSDFNEIFGGFTTKSWKTPYSSKSEWILDDSAFIFRVAENANQLLSLFRKFIIKQDMKQNAILANTNLLPVFGGGHDICIVSDCNLTNASYASFVHSYELPKNNTFKYGIAEYFLTSSFRFKVVEIEVFKIII